MALQPKADRDYHYRTSNPVERRCACGATVWVTDATLAKAVCAECAECLLKRLEAKYPQPAGY